MSEVQDKLNELTGMSKRFYIIGKELGWPASNHLTSLARELDDKIIELHRAYDEETSIHN